MPHFTVDCSANILGIHDSQEIMQTIHEVAELSLLFAKGDIKVRIQPFNLYTVAGSKSDFIHVFGNIMEGRSIAQKSSLSKAIVNGLLTLFPNVGKFDCLFVCLLN